MALSSKWARLPKLKVAARMHRLVGVRREADACDGNGGLLLREGQVVSKARGADYASRYGGQTGSVLARYPFLGPEFPPLSRVVPGTTSRRGIMSPSHCLRGSVLCLALALPAGGGAAPSTPSVTRDAPKASAAAQGSAKPAASASAEAIAPAKPGQIVAAYSEITAANAGLWGAKEGGIFQK